MTCFMNGLSNSLINIVGGKWNFLYNTDSTASLKTLQSLEKIIGHVKNYSEYMDKKRKTLSGHGFKQHMRSVWKVRGLITMSWNFVEMWVSFFEVPPLASNALLTMLHPLQTVCCKLREDSGTGSFDLSCSFFHL